MAERFGPYELVDLLGRGGMGEVYRARDTARNRVVALKVLPPHLAADEYFASRFRRESQLAAQLNDPHIVPIHDFGEIDGRLFIDMRLVNGEDLASVLERQHTLPPAAAVDIVAQVASALDAAHAEGLLHRDVKPSNVMLTGSLDDLVARPPFAYLVDFGIARSTTQKSALTDASAPIGTAAYMSPERIAGEVGDARGDVYALTCVLYECLTGRLPFDGDVVQLMYQHMHAPRPRPGAVTPAAAALDEVIATGLAVDPAQRYATAGDLALAARAAVSTTLPAAFPAGGEASASTSPGHPRPAARDDVTRIVPGALGAAAAAAESPRPSPGRRPRPRPGTGSPLAALRTNLPAAVAELVGRDAEFAELCALLGGTDRLVTVTGPGGTGKTTLGIAVSRELLGRTRDGAFLVELAEVARADEVPAAVAAVFGVPADALTGALRGRELLLFLDNFEHVLDAAPFVSSLLAAAPGVRILVTSQAPLRVVAEHVVPLHPLGRADALDLLTARAGRASGVADDATQRGALEALCAELDGSPLAIELAAARLAVLSPTELLGRLRQSVDALGTGRRDLPGRHRGLRAAMQWSYDLLDEDARTLFRRLGHFAGPARLERVEQVCGDGSDGVDPVESLAELVEHSLVRRRPDERYELASALRTFARELLDPDELAGVRQHHAAAVVGEWLPDGRRYFFSQVEREARILEEAPDVVALLDWSAADAPHLFPGLIGVSYNVLRQLGLLDRFRVPVERALDEGWAVGRFRVAVQLALFSLDRSRVPAPDAADFEHDQAFEGGYLAQVAGARLLVRAATPDDVEGTIKQLTDWPDAAVRATVPVLRGMLLWARGDWSAAADAMSSALDTRTGAWLDKLPRYFLGDCELLAGHPDRALHAYGAGLRDGLERRVIVDTAFQGEGIAAALADLGRPADALHALGAVDQFTGTGAHPRDIAPDWGRLVTERLDRARAALEPSAADIAYGRSAGQSLDAAAATLLALSE